MTSAFDRATSRRGRQCLEEIRRRLDAGELLTPAQQGLVGEAAAQSRRADWLAPLEGVGSLMSMVSEAAYLELLDWTGRQIRGDRRGAIPESVKAILDQLAIDADSWAETVKHYGSLFYRLAGRVERMLEVGAKIGSKRLRGIGASRKAFGPPLQRA